VPTRRADRPTIESLDERELGAKDLNQGKDPLRLVSSRPLVYAVVLALLLSSVPVSVAGSGSGTSATASSEGGRIEAVYPNPVADGDAGEFVVLFFPRGTDLTGWTLTDGETVVRLGNGTVGGRVVVTAEPTIAGNLTSRPVLALDDSVSLANGGDELALQYRNETIDAIRYEDAPDAEVFRRTNGTDGSDEADGSDSIEESWRWVPLGATDFEPTQAGATTARAFVLPDAPSVPIETIRGAERRILIGGYSFASQRVGAALRRAAARGVEVRILLDDAPAGGISTPQARVLDSLAASGSGVDIEVLGGSYARYDFHHPKYAVVDDSALVTTENWKPAGTGGHASRGWGVVVESARIANGLAAIFRADIGWRDTVSWRKFRQGRTFTEETLANESYPTNFEARSVPVESATLLAAPDNAERAVLRELDRANESIAVIQASIGSRDLPFVEALLRAAERGVDVRVLLSSAWYSEEDNEAMAAWLNRRAEAENLSLDARVADPGDRFAKIHAKGVLVDRETAIVGSLNWNSNSVRENREVALALDGEEIGAYYGRVFDADWTGGDGKSGPGSETNLPIGLIAAVGGVVVLAVLVGRRIDFSE
jgi:phosphatidylserine/phosphatidylglycerophosphate/cardiolipin synthase-like enzyme